MRRRKSLYITVIAIVLFLACSIASRLEVAHASHTCYIADILEDKCIYTNMETPPTGQAYYY